MNTIITHKKYLMYRCAERGYSLEEVMPCVVSQDGDSWTIDIDHAKYPKLPKVANQNIEGGVGTELKKLLKLIGITATPTCPCNTRAKIMDDNGIQWCEDNKDTIIDWLKEAAQARSLPFSEIAAKMILNLAIKKAKKSVKINRK